MKAIIQRAYGRGARPGPRSLAARVEPVGPGVAQHKPGEDVFGECVRGIQWKNGGAFAEYASVLAKDLAPMPGRLTYAEVTGVDSSEKLEVLRSIGADHVIDFATTDFTTTGEQYDLIIDSLYPLTEIHKALRHLEQETAVGKIVITIPE